ncbi:hypothetical protein NE619_07725 [Anaerovorax odorimutans]|uniref:Fibronectin type-III domain-containing protein n=1 Tax=Anaerovorax odorimutans TaxID=109327 RepID=A0ABT1RN68_9FIRM|nr:hypothetical protein [Anaerovorax odorimutans]MCQ4636615.1 hypothetical protein [Anaerovorax odorimutans]
MSRTKKHAALIIAMIMAFTVIPGAIMADTASAATKLSKPKLTNHAASSTSIKNTWNKVKGAKGYEVYRSTKAKGKYKKVKTIKKGKTVSWTNKKLKKNKKYYYKVRAYKMVKGKKKYSKFSSAQWAKTTNKPNPVFSMSSKAATTSTISVKITNKGRYKMVVNPEEMGIFFKNPGAAEAASGLSDKELEDINMLSSKGVYIAFGEKITINPGKAATVKYTPIDVNGNAIKVSYSSSGILYGTFTFNKKTYEFTASKKYGYHW